MASSSTSTSYGNTDCYVFDIFINHRGPDVKTTLATDLYNRLSEHGLRVFLDKPALEKGESLSPQIQSAIRTASVQIAILSPGYADSKWCLDELVWMLKSSSTIIPIFYGVQPADVRFAKDGKGIYGRALCNLRGKTTHNGQPRYKPSDIDEWGDALYKVADKIGFDQETYKGVKTGVLQCFEAVFQLCNLPLVWSAKELLEDVVEAVLKKVQRRLDVSQYPRGLEERLEGLETIVSLNQSGKARVIGIVGLGGIGKTTLAKEFFNGRRSNYKRSSFLFDIKDGSLTTLQSNLLEDLIQSKEQIRSTDEGKEKLRRFLSSSHALIILDDVDSIEQLEALLLPVKDVLNTRSLILVTSRNKDVLTSSDIPESSIYSLTGLNPQHCRELFCLHAFGQSHPAVGFDKVAEKFSAACHGLPLSLKVLGALLHGKEDLNHWEAQFRKLSNILPANIQSRLKISYNGLDEEEKQIFLDISCFFIGENKDTVIRIWEGCGWEGSLGLQKLVNRCLVEVDNKNCITMHDHLRDLGRYLAEKEPPGGELRIWRPTQNLVHELSRESPVRGISMHHGNDAEQSFENLTQLARSRLLTNMNRLQLLRAEGCFVEQLYSIGQLPPPIYLRWENCLNSCLPYSISIKNLRVLHIESYKLKTLWQDESQAPLQLRELYIYAPISHVPKSIGKLKKLEIFALKFGCFETLPNEMGNLTGLQSLNLSGCSTLQALPDRLGNLTGLQRLKLRWCYTLQALPDRLGNLTGLQRLNLRGCSTLQALPDRLVNLTGLQRLDLRDCSTLQALPNRLGNLTGLQRLNLRGCSTLQTLPDRLWNLTGVQSLELSWCSTLQALPDRLGNLTGLQSLDLSGCSTLQALPNSLGNLTGLQSLVLSGCSTLQALPDSLGNLTGLERLYLRECSNLQMLANVEHLSSLEILAVCGCPKLQWGTGVVEQLRQRLGEDFMEESEEEFIRENEEEFIIEESEEEFIGENEEESGEESEKARKKAGKKASGAVHSDNGDSLSAGCMQSCQ